MSSAPGTAAQPPRASRVATDAERHCVPWRFPVLPSVREAGLVIIPSVVDRSWRIAAGLGLLIVAGCVVVIAVVLRVKGLQQAAGVAGLVSLGLRYRHW